MHKRRQIRTFQKWLKTAKERRVSLVIFIQFQGAITRSQKTMFTWVYITTSTTNTTTQWLEIEIYNHQY